MKPLKIPSKVKPVWTSFQMQRKRHEREQARAEKAVERARLKYIKAKKALEVVQDSASALHERQQVESRTIFGKLIAACQGTEVNAGQLMLTLTKPIPTNPPTE